MDRGWVRNGCGPNLRIRHGYDSALPLGRALEAEIGVMEQICLKRGYGLMDGAIGEASRVRRLSDLLIASGFGRRLNFFYKRSAPTGVAPCFFFPHLYHVQPDPIPFPDVEELSKQLKIARKRQEAEHAARPRCQEEKERRKREEKEQKEREEAARKEVEVKAQCDREEAEKCVCEEKGKEKVRGTSVGSSVLLTRLYRRSSS